MNGRVIFLEQGPTKVDRVNRATRNTREIGARDGVERKGSARLRGRGNTPALSRIDAGDGAESGNARARHSAMLRAREAAPKAEQRIAMRC